MFGEQGLVNMHQVSGYTHITILPAGLYGERTLLMGGKVCVPQDTDLDIVDWLADVGLAPDEIIRVPHTCLFTGLRRRPDLQAKLAGWFAAGIRPMFFRPTELEARFVQDMGLTWEQTASCDPALADLVGRKDFLRRLAAAHGPAKIFPPHEFVASPWDADAFFGVIQRVHRQARDMGSRHVIVKRTDLVSGEGMCRTTSPRFRSFLDENRSHPLIVEVEIDPHVPINNLWVVLDGRAEYVGASRQLQDGYVHKGNVIASNDRMLPETVVWELRRLAEPLMDRLVAMGYNGVIGFEAVWQQERDRVFLTAANARVAASTYPFAVARRLGFGPWSIANRIMVPAPWFETFNSVRGALGSMLYNPRRRQGVVPYMIGALKHTTLRRMGLMAVADNPCHAEQSLTEAVRRLTELRN